MANCSAADLPFAHDNEFLELVCENGQIVMQGQSSRNRMKNLQCTGFSSPSSKAQDKDGGDAVTPNTGNMDALFNDFSSSGPSRRMGLGQDDDIVPWLNYPLDDTMQHDYCSEFFSELTGVNLNPPLSSQNNNVVPFDKNSSFTHMVRDPNLASEPTRPRTSTQTHPSSSAKECQTLNPSPRPRVSDFISINGNNPQRPPYRNSNQTPANMKTQKQDQEPTRSLPQPSNTGGLMNFSYFSRPAAIVKANLQNIGIAPSPGLSSVDRSRSKDKISAVSSNPVESTVIDLVSGSRSIAGFQNPPVQMASKVDIEPSNGKPAKEFLSAEQSRAICREHESRITQLPDQIIRPMSSFAASTTVGRPVTEKSVESLVAPSSMCSANSEGGTSDDHRQFLKRKSQEVDESEYQSEDVEEESVGARKPSNVRGGSGAKRTRAAEVHNLSERRRRDRINEKMRALQELIPNCNKVDKASMLDEAIEYLKTLQLQVQIMSMGTGLYMPPMMLPTGMQHIPGQHFPHFPPMGVGMGMGMGFGMGMLEMGNGSSMMQVPPMHNMQFPCPPLSRPNSFPPMPGSNIQMFGHLSQGMPMSMPPAPFVPPAEGPFTKSVLVPDVSVTATAAEVPGSASSSGSKDPIKKVNSQITQNASAECPQIQTSQDQATTDNFELSTVAQ